MSGIDVIDPDGRAAMLLANAAKRKAKAAKRKASGQDVRESKVEERHIENVRASGGESFKFVSPARRSVPDRLDLWPIPEAHRAIVAQYVRFAECKRPGEKPTPSQAREHERLRALGFEVDIVDVLAPRTLFHAL